jgi:DNA polymerase zeta
LQEKCIRILFETHNLDDVKSYFCSQLWKILQGGDKLYVCDYTFSKEVKQLDKYSSLPNGGQIVKHNMVIDKMTEPPHKWRGINNFLYYIY